MGGGMILVGDGGASESGGGLAVWEGTSATLINSNVYANNAWFNGGGLYIDGGTVLLANETALLANHASGAGTLDHVMCSRFRMRAMS